jgi:Domain of unknown function (DUF4158)
MPEAIIAAPSAAATQPSQRGSGLPRRARTTLASAIAESASILAPSMRLIRWNKVPAHEHQWEIRHERGYREFAAGEAELRAFLAARVWALEEGPRVLFFDRAVLWLIEHRSLLPGITVLGRLVAEAARSSMSGQTGCWPTRRRRSKGGGRRSCWCCRTTRDARGLISSGAAG